MTHPGSDTQTPADRGEPIAMMEPVRLYEGARERDVLTDLALELAQAAAALRHQLPDPIVAALAELVRAMNCYYSNLIEGHDTHPVDIERALKQDYSDEPRQRDLQLEATAHIAVQRWIDDGGLYAQRAVSADGLREIHRRFYDHLPQSLRTLTDPVTGHSSTSF